MLYSTQTHIYAPIESDLDEIYWCLSCLQRRSEYCECVREIRNLIEILFPESINFLL